MARDHSHSPPRPDHPPPQTRHRFLDLALNELLIERGLYTEAELRDMIASIDSVDPSTHGARVVARSWIDADFRRRLLNDANAAIADIGMDPGTAHLRVLENTPETHNVVVCTLCSCYPRALLGRPPGLVQGQGVPRKGGAGAPRGTGGIRSVTGGGADSQGPRLHRGTALSRTPGTARRNRTPGGIRTGRPGHPGRHDRRGETVAEAPSFRMTARAAVSVRGTIAFRSRHHLDDQLFLAESAPRQRQGLLPRIIQ